MRAEAVLIVAGPAAKYKNLSTVGVGLLPQNRAVTRARLTRSAAPR